MDILRNLFGSLTSGIIRLLVTVGILAAVYFLIVKPVLKTTSDISRETNSSIEKSFEQSFGDEGGLSDVSKTIEDVNRRVQREIRRSFHSSKQQGNAHRLIRCIQRAHQDVNRIQRCTQKF
jgi:hypothetical protein